MPGKRTGRSGNRNIASSRNNNTSRSSSRGSDGPGKTVLAFFLGAAVAAGGGYLYLHSTPQPIAPPSAQLPKPAPTAPVRPPRSSPPSSPPASRTPPFGASEDVFEAGARTYAAQCAGCHGTPRADAASNPPAPQIWRGARHSTAAHTVADIYQGIAIGAPAKGMPGYTRTLTDTNLWQLALLLKDADQDLPDPVVAILNGAAHRPQRSE